MQRRNFLAFCGGALLGRTDQAGAAPLPFQDEKSKLKITGVRLVRLRPRRPVPNYAPAPGSWSTQGAEVANPMSIYPEYKATRSLFSPDPGGLGDFTVEISTDKGVKGYGSGGIGGGEVVTGHFTKLLIGEDPFNIERIWDILFRSSMSYGQAGVVRQRHQRRGPGAVGSDRHRAGNAGLQAAGRRDQGRAFPRTAPATTSSSTWSSGTRG